MVPIGQRKEDIEHRARAADLDAAAPLHHGHKIGFQSFELLQTAANFHELAVRQLPCLLARGMTLDLKQFRDLGQTEPHPLGTTNESQSTDILGLVPSNAA